MRILMIAQSYAPVVGGEERIVEDLSRELVARGHAVLVATLRQSVGAPGDAGDGVSVELLDGSFQRIPGLPVDPERQYAPPAPDPVAAIGLRRLLASFRPDVVHAHNWLGDSYLPFAKGPGPAFVLSLHDYSLVCATKRFFYGGGLCSGPALGKCLRHSTAHYGTAKGALIAVGVHASAGWLRRRVDFYLPVSEAVRELSGLGPGERHRVVPNFIRGLPPAPSPGERRLAALPDEPFVYYFGDLTEDKGVGVLVEAWRRLRERPPLVLAGRPLIDLPELPDLIQLGRLPHELAIEALRRSMFSVVPSLLPESFGIVALEAAAAGKPVIASAIGGLPDVVADGENGILVAPGDVDGLERALGRLCDEEGLRDRMSAAALKVASRFSPDAVVPEFEAAYEEACMARLKVTPAESDKDGHPQPGE